LSESFFEMTEKNRVNSVKICPKTKNNRKFKSYFRQTTEMYQRKKKQLGKEGTVSSGENKCR